MTSTIQTGILRTPDVWSPELNLIVSHTTWHEALIPLRCTALIKNLNDVFFNEMQVKISYVDILREYLSRNRFVSKINLHQHLWGVKNSKVHALSRQTKLRAPCAGSSSASFPAESSAMDLSVAFHSAVGTDETLGLSWGRRKWNSSQTAFRGVPTEKEAPADNFGLCILDFTWVRQAICFLLGGLWRLIDLILAWTKDTRCNWYSAQRVWRCVLIALFNNALLTA